MKNIIIFGAGNFGRKALYCYWKCRVAYFADNDKNKQGTSVDGIRILSFEEYAGIAADYSTVIACAEYNPIVRQLEAAGITNYTVFLPNRLGILRKENINIILDSNYKPCKRSIKNILYFGDNSDVLNWGCRATSKALYKLISRNTDVSDIVRRREILSLFPNIESSGSITEYFLNIRDNDETLTRLKDLIDRNDALVINGEGEFIFRTPARHDLCVTLLIILMCIVNDKPVYLLNAMFSDGTGYEKNDVILSETVKILSHVSLAAARDKLSFSYLKSADREDRINLKYIPDALFTEYEVFEEQKHILRSFIDNIGYCKAFSPVDTLAGPEISCLSDYAILSGNSYIAAFQKKAFDIFTRLALKLKERLSEEGVSLYLAECCEGDHFLRRVSEVTKIPILGIENNIYLDGAVLGNARCFISGRYHPSILAMLGGTPCVFMGSNSHKTESLQEVMGSENPRSFSPEPSEYEIRLIAEAAVEMIREGDALRVKLKNKCAENSLLASEMQYFYDM